MGKDNRGKGEEWSRTHGQNQREIGWRVGGGDGWGGGSGGGAEWRQLYLNNNF